MYPQLPPTAAADVDATFQVDEPAADAIEILPDVPMLNIFSHIPLFDLMLTIPQVSPRLANLKAEAGRQRNSLTLLLGDGAEHLLEKAIAKFPNLPPSDSLSKMVFREKRLVLPSTRNLTRSLSNITSLTVVLARAKEEKSELWEVIGLLCVWFDQLTDLVLVFGTSNEFLSLQPFINRLSHLRHLTIFLDRPFPRDISPFDFPVMAHLESFNCHFPGELKLFLPSMARYFVNNQQASSIDFGSEYGIEDKDKEAFLSLPPTVCRLFRRLQCCSQWRPEELQRLCLSFQCLTFLEFYLMYSFWPGLPHSLPLVAARLQSLTCLTELHLVIYDDTPNRALPRQDIEAEEEPLPSDAIMPALPTVTFLTLAFIDRFSSHQDLVPFHFEKMLPNLKRFLLDGDCGCSVCDLPFLIIDEDAIEERVACAQQVFAPIRPLFGTLELAQVGFLLDVNRPIIRTLA